MKKTFKLICPHCKNQMNYQPSSLILVGKKKRCVYCGKSFLVRQNMIKEV